MKINAEEQKGEQRGLIYSIIKTFMDSDDYCLSVAVEHGEDLNNILGKLE